MSDVIKLAESRREELEAAIAQHELEIAQYHEEIKSLEGFLSTASALIKDGRMPADSAPQDESYDPKDDVFERLAQQAKETKGDADMSDESDADNDAQLKTIRAVTGSPT